MKAQTIREHKLKLKPIDLMKATGKEGVSKRVYHCHPDISTGKSYLAKIGGAYFAGKFSNQWYGLNFDGWHGNGLQWHGNGLQFDMPGTNASTWEALWEIVTVK